MSWAGSNEAAQSGEAGDAGKEGIVPSIGEGFTILLEGPCTYVLDGLIFTSKSALEAFSFGLSISTT